MRHELHALPEPNWFHHGPQILDLLERYRPVVCVELGSNAGCSAIAVARLIRGWDGTLTCVDSWDQQSPTPATVGLAEFVQNIKSAGVNSVIRILCSDSVKASGTFPCESIDYLYVDADHSREGCLADLIAWWPRLRVGGLIAGDDYDDPNGDPTRGVTAAWDEFELRYKQHFERTRTFGLDLASRLIWGIK